MEIIKIAFFALIALFFIIIVQQSRKDLAVIISLFVGVSIFVFIFGKFNAIILFLQDMALKANINTVYLNIVLKILAISYIASFCSEICKDAGSNNIASKVEFGGKILILFLAVPILMAVLQSILNIM
ncbi:stage III sporulation protein AD [Candidatus Arthromitus sp. SFB-mouse-Japan]|uniref:stage III sporulation protein AD n=1 Tax=unclassified Candidatus Neoarthromitus TaxID=2638829 RepID=UPI00021B7D79|nr:MULTISPECIES: stage III sporulation protein AD [unclassified Candidatus Arthromitus]EIA24537.1 Putative stage III sporulation protein AD [Candidatus Arthromitus sp. SFB-1]EIA27981.1 Putative stage III sporulation protein AD [Candidatus Arthromitus sp. SFB-4]EIA28779.1 Putative stage III sporulation protein AD [Candidatus Arthromitus sp. SFB-co]EIA31009.1 Putative stage III sporulation protein AD [Candidatus Arthromitus sp. SFB-mouse-SU]AID44952.1 Stage III sporulation protein AD [Candidatus